LNTPENEIRVSTWQVAEHSLPVTSIDDLGLTAPKAATLSLSAAKVSVASIPLRSRAIPVRTFRFGAPLVAQAKPAAEKSSAPAEPLVFAKPPAPDRKSMAPPKDVIKLEDRLFFLLQPPLEIVFAADKLALPFDPFPYQFDGIAFLFPRHAAILADEMGLGKTMQSICAIRLLIRSGQASRVLLICPKPLMTNWRREFALWAPELTVAIIEGDAAKRRWLWEQDDIPIKIANYELLGRDQDAFLHPATHFDLVMLDEAQRIKNTDSTTAEIACQIPRTRSWALTGTPIENTPDDLVGIFEFLAPRHVHKGMPLKALAEAVRDFILRRTKDMVMTDMPPRLMRDAEIDLHPAQRLAYQMAEEEAVIQLNALGDSITIQHVFEKVLRLKQICNFDPVTGASAKLERLEADLEEVAASGRKAIVFSQWVNVIDKLEAALKRFHPLCYHGRIPSNQRDGVIERFRNDSKSSVLLMSYGAGSVGLNLQFCNYVFLFDRWWNPAIEDQAINRAHRIGVKGAVTVTRMTSMDTIEQRIHDILEHKRQIFAAVLADAGSPASLGMNEAEIFGLFNLKSPPRSQHKKAA
jgi:SNF2 family DNA or RNA helicase